MQAEYFILDRDIEYGWEESFEEGPVVRRGWIIQERLLAPRVLHFGRKQLFWECNSLAGCESRPHGLRWTTSPGWNPSSPHIWKRLLDETSRLEGCGPVQQAFVDWNQVVTNYSGCQVTVASDRLVALSGLANDMKRKLRGLGCEMTSYLAGLWAVNLPLSLAWFTSVPSSRPSQYRAPSWSWASIEGPVSFYDWPLTKNANVFFYTSFIRAEVDTLRGLETGKVSYGKMVLKGYLALAEIAPCSWKKIKTFRDIEDPTHTWTPEEWFKNEENSWEINECSIQLDAEDKLSEIYCLPIYAQQESNFYWAIVFLVLTCKDQDFARIGCLQIYTTNPEEFHNCFQQFPERTIEIV